MSLLVATPWRSLRSLLVACACVFAAVVGSVVPAGALASAQIDPPTTVVAELFADEAFGGVATRLTDTQAGEHTVSGGIGSLTLVEGWDAVLCTGADGSGTCRVHSDGAYPSLPGFGQPVRYACVHFRKTPGELGPCPSFGDQPVEHTLTPVQPLDEQACRDQFRLELDPNTVKSSSSTSVYTRKVLVLVHNPQIQQPGTDNVNDLFSWMGWPSMAPRVACLSRFYHHASNGRMNFNVVGITDIDLWPDNDMQKGWDYASTDVNRPVEPDDKVDNQELGQLLVNKVFVNGRSVCDMIRSGDVEELWIYNAGGFGYFETALLGPQSYEYNWASLRGVDCGRTFRIAAGSASRGLMLHNMMHGMESALRATQGILDAGNPNQGWDRIDGDSAVHLFMRSPKDLVEGTVSNSPVTGCGDTHFTPSMQTRRLESGWEHEYWYGDRALEGGSEPFAWSRESACAQIPTLSTRGPLDATVAAAVRADATAVNCSAWSCSEFGFYEYWHENWSDGIGCQLSSATAQEGIWFDWWRYFADPVAVYETCQPVALAGDSDCDGVRTNLDAALIVRSRVQRVTVRSDCASGTGELSVADADFDGSGFVDLVDALMIATCVATPTTPYCQ